MCHNEAPTQPKEIFLIRKKVREMRFEQGLKLNSRVSHSLSGGRTFLMEGIVSKDVEICGHTLKVRLFSMIMNFQQSVHVQLQR